MKVTLNYEPQSGNITDDKGNFVGTYIGLEASEGGVSIEALCKLKNAGFSAEEITELKRKEVL
jgi:hypothetical protein